MTDQIEQIENQDNQENNMERGYESNGRGEANDESLNGRNGNGGANRGFAAMSPERQKQIASEGGRAAHKQGVAHEWNSDEARRAGRKGGQIVSQNREHMSEIGRRGGQSSGGKRSRNQQNDSESRGE